MLTQRNTVAAPRVHRPYEAHRRRNRHHGGVSSLAVTSDCSVSILRPTGQLPCSAGISRQMSRCRPLLVPRVWGRSPGRRVGGLSSTEKGVRRPAAPADRVGVDYRVHDGLRLDLRAVHRRLPALPDPGGHDRPDRRLAPDGPGAKENQSRRPDRRRCFGSLRVLGECGLCHYTAAYWNSTQTGNYIDVQRTFSDVTGHPLDSKVIVGSRFPSPASAGTIFVKGRCQDVYLSFKSIPKNAPIPGLFDLPVERAFDAPICKSLVGPR